MVKTINILKYQRHVILIGEQMRFRHFRNGKQLPWILNYSHYDFDFQLNVHLPTEVTVSPGDQLTIGVLVYNHTFRQKY